MFAVILSALHVLALAVGFAAVFARGRALRAVAGGDHDAVPRVLSADGFWGLAAGLWAATGLMRAFGGIEKGPDFYLNNGFFWIKMGLFALVLLLELTPMITFVRWRAARAKGAALDLAPLPLLVRINDAELAIVLLIPFVAAAMARGIWLFA